MPSIFPVSGAPVSGFRRFLSPPIISVDMWHKPLSEPARFLPGLKASEHQFLAFHPFPLPDISIPWFVALSEPVRFLPGLPVSLQQFLSFCPLPLPNITIPWFMALSEPVRFLPGLPAALQQFLATPSRFLPNPSIIGTMNVTELGDIFFAGASVFNRPITGEVGLIEPLPVQTSNQVATVAQVMVSIREI